MNGMSHGETTPLLHVVVELLLQKAQVNHCVWCGSLQMAYQPQEIIIIQASPFLQKAKGHGRCIGLLPTLRLQKLLQREANLAVRLKVSGVRRSIVSLNGSLSINDRFAASERVNRLVRSGGARHRPHFVSDEEQRTKLDFEQGMTLCPACPESDKKFPRHLPMRYALIIHLVRTIGFGRPGVLRSAHLIITTGITFP